MPDASRTVLGFDFGGKRIGVAVGSQTDSTYTSQALTAIHSSQGVPDWPAIGQLIDTWQPDTLIVGLPYNPDADGPHGKPEHDPANSIATRARRFSRQLHGRYHLPVELVDERWSSEAARAEHATQRALGKHASRRQTNPRHFTGARTRADRINNRPQHTQHKGKRGGERDCLAARLIIEQWFNESS